MKIIVISDVIFFYLVWKCFTWEEIYYFLNYDVMFEVKRKKYLKRLGHKSGKNWLNFIQSYIPPIFPFCSNSYKLNPNIWGPYFSITYSWAEIFASQSFIWLSCFITFDENLQSGLVSFMSGTDHIQGVPIKR